jgi:hypothetical protein
MKNGSIPASLVACFLSALSLSLSTAQGSSIRTVTADDGSIVLVNTALGYSTILEFESKPLSAVLGDSDSFKLEYVGNSITLKPLIAHAKSNLFVFTESDRFSCRIQTVPPVEVDYILRIHTRDRSYPIGGSVNAAKPVTVRIDRSFTYDGYTLTLLSKTQDADQHNPHAITILDFELSSRERPYAFQSTSIGVKQGERYITSESLYLDALEIAPGQPPVRGKVAVFAQDFKPRTSITLVFGVPEREHPASTHRIEVSTRPARRGKSSTVENIPADPKGGATWGKPTEATNPKKGP